MPATVYCFLTATTSPNSGRHTRSGGCRCRGEITPPDPRLLPMRKKKERHDAVSPTPLKLICIKSWRRSVSADARNHWPKQGAPEGARGCRSVGALNPAYVVAAH